jgi:Rrf2 family protein
MLSHKCKYAIKALEYIYKNKDREPILIAEISEKQKIPKKFLETILLDLKRDGILQSKMGKNGGYSLMKKPSEINIGHIIRLIDGPIALLPCVSYKYYKRCDDCEDEATCGLHNVLAQLREANNKILNKVSLAELIKKENKLKK